MTQVRAAIAESSFHEAYLAVGDKIDLSIKYCDVLGNRYLQILCYLSTPSSILAKFYVPHFSFYQVICFMKQRG